MSEKLTLANIPGASMGPVLQPTQLEPTAGFQGVSWNSSYSWHKVSFNFEVAHEFISRFVKPLSVPEPWLVALQEQKSGLIDVGRTGGEGMSYLNREHI